MFYNCLYCITCFLYRPISYSHICICERKQTITNTKSGKIFRTDTNIIPTVRARVDNVYNIILIYPRYYCTQQVPVFFSLREYFCYNNGCNIFCV